jgi:hypothetical protein
MRRYVRGHMRRYSSDRGREPRETRLQFVPVERSLFQLIPQLGNLCKGLSSLFFESADPFFEFGSPHPFLRCYHDGPRVKRTELCGLTRALATTLLRKDQFEQEDRAVHAVQHAAATVA